MSSQVPGIPDGFELIAIRRVADGEFFISLNGSVVKWSGPKDSDSVYPIVCKIEKPKQYRPFANAAEYLPHWGKPIRKKQDPIGFDSIASVGDYACYICEGAKVSDLSFAEVFEDYEFADGTPFGVEVQE